MKLASTQSWKLPGGTGTCRMHSAKHEQNQGGWLLRQQTQQYLQFSVLSMGVTETQLVACSQKIALVNNSALFLACYEYKCWFLVSFYFFSALSSLLRYFALVWFLHFFVVSVTVSFGVSQQCTKNSYNTGIIPRSCVPKSHRMF